MKIKVSDYIADFLHAQNTEYVFEMAGGMIAHILDSFYQRKSTTVVSMHHEQSAAFAVDGYGRITGRPSVALATSGPGATNLLTGIGSCYFDSSPSLFITGQVNRHEQKGDRPIRQLGFQETDIVSMATPITKRSYRITSPDEIVSTLHEAYLLAISDRPGPVLIDIPMDIQSAVIEAEKPCKLLSVQHTVRLNPAIKNIDLLFDYLVQSKRPLILAGGGINCAQAKKAFSLFVETLKIPVVVSLLGLDVLPYAHPQRTGFIGSYGNRWANIALGECDCLIVIGSRLDIRQTGANVASFVENKKIFHVDCDEGEINNRITGCVPITLDIMDFLRYANEKLSLIKLPDFSAWKNSILEQWKRWPDTKELSKVEGINPNVFFHALSEHSHHAAGYVADVGAHQMWAAQSLALSDDQFFMTSGGMGAMGFSLPAAIGASLANQKKPVVVIVGDGSMQVNIQELQTVVRNKIPLKIVIINNQSLGMITQFQDSYFEGRYQSTYWGYSAPDFSALGVAYGIESRKIANEDESLSSIQWLWENPDEPMILEVMVTPHMHVYPKIAFGRPITEMEPFVKPVAMEGT